MDGKLKVIIVGYPKSGNTWLTRLTAELIGCPVQGFLYEEDNKEIAIEGLDRNSKYVCFKSHHQYHELADEDVRNAKIIYIIRDPRDIVISGIYYFYNLRIINPGNFKNLKLKYSLVLINAIFKRIIGLRKMKRRMLKAVLEGNIKVHHWCRISWRQHLIPYSNNKNILKIQYEKLHENPKLESKRILKFLEIKKNDDQIGEAILNQSFNRVKQKYKEDNDFSREKFLRKGLTKQWKQGLTKKENEKIAVNLRAELLKFGYELS